jgi:hypothetical protein
LNIDQINIYFDSKFWTSVIDQILFGPCKVQPCEE